MISPAPPRWALAVHGGAGMMSRTTLSPDDYAGARGALGRALDAGAVVLAADGGALDAVEAAVRVLEEDPRFNAGRGAVLTADGTAELDAAIIDGATRRAGAVAGVSRTRAPVSLARAVMERSDHVFLAGAGADAFALTTGLEQVAPDWFHTAERTSQHAELAGGFDRAMKYGTVGAVARDVAGHVAAATSTGGVSGKRWGRVGDSPLIGAGTYADDRAGAVSATGTGEVFIRVGVAHEICARVRLLGEDIAAAAEAVIAEVGALGGAGGVIAVSAGGDIAWAFDTPGMYRARRASDDRGVASIYGDEV